MKNTTKQSKLFTRDFTLVVVGQIISLFGNSILRFALPLYLLRQTGSAALFGLVSACSFFPMIVLSLVGGVLADRVNKRNIMVVLDFCTAGVITAFSLLLGFSPLVPLMLVTLMLLYGIQGTYQPAVQASIPALLPPERVLAGNAVINQISALSGLVGPVAGGMLLGGWGLWPILVVSGVCFLVSAIMELFIRIPHQPRQQTGSAIAIVRADLGESFRFIRHQKPVFIHIMLLAVLINLFLSAMITVGLPVIVTGTLGLSDQLMGYCQGALAVGALVGGGAVAAMGNRMTIRGIPATLGLAALALLPICLVLLPGVSPLAAYVVITLCCMVVMAAATVASILLLAYVQTETPQELVGKVISCVIAGSMCAQPMGQALYGVLFQYATPWMVVLGAVLASMAICIYAHGSFRSLFKP